MDTKPITVNEWKAEARRRFGDDPMDWRFVCPVCGAEQGARDFEKSGLTPDEIDNVVAFSCVGRWVEGVGCHYAGGGLFRLNPTHVESHGKAHLVMEFADATHQESGASGGAPPIADDPQESGKSQ